MIDVLCKTQTLNFWRSIKSRLNINCFKEALFYLKVCTEPCNKIEIFPKIIRIFEKNHHIYKYGVWRGISTIFHVGDHVHQAIKNYKKNQRVEINKS